MTYLSDTPLTEEMIKKLGLILPWDKINQDIPLYKYCSYKTANKIIENQKVKFSVKRKFNDPFDVAPTMIPLTYESIRKDFKENREFYRGIDIPTTAALKKSIKKWNKNLRLNDFNEKLDEVKIYCLTENENDILMWSHYANSHEGICLEFKNPRVFLTANAKDKFFIIPHPVDYTEKENRPTWEMISPSERNANKQRKQLMNILTTKYHIWEYENEWRALRFFQKNQLTHINPVDVKISNKAITSCTFGLRTSESQQKEFMKKCREKGFNIQFKRARMHEKDYALEYENIS